MEENAPQVKKTKKKSSTNWLMTIGISLILTAAVLLVWFFMHGETTVTGGWENSKKALTLTCEAEESGYPLFAENVNGLVKTIVMFDSDTIETASLMWKAKYSSEQARTEGRLAASKIMDEALIAAGLKNDGLGVNYSSLGDNVFQMSLYAKGSELRNGLYKFFMLNDITGGSYNLETVKKVYENQGLECVVKD